MSSVICISPEVRELREAKEMEGWRVRVLPPAWVLSNVPESLWAQFGDCIGKVGVVEVKRHLLTGYITYVVHFDEGGVPPEDYPQRRLEFLSPPT